MPTTRPIADGDALLPPRVFLASNPAITLARVGLGLTVYLEDGAYWANGGAAHWLQRFLCFVDPAELRYASTSAIDRWVSVEPREHAAWVDALGQRGLLRPLRPFFELRLVDDPGAPRVGFLYREIDTARASRTAWMQLLFPREQAPEDLRAFAIELATEAPLACGVGGWLARWNPTSAPAALREIERWTRRYLGLDVQAPDRWSYVARRGVPTISWLHLLGPELSARLDRSVMPPSVARLSLARSSLVVAGELPSLGDAHRIEHPSAMFEAGRYLSPVLASALPAPPGWDADATARWQRRFVDFQGWA